MTTIARVTRTSVLADDSMVGKKVITLDGETVKITGVASSYAYSHDQGRSRLSAYLLVKDGRNFKQIEQEDVDGKVTNVEDAGGYAKYTFAGKGKKAAPKAAPKADPKPEPKVKPKAGGKKAPAAAPEVEPKVKPKAGGKKAPVKPEPAPKAGGKGKAGVAVRRNAERHELPEGMALIAAENALSPAAVSELRVEIQQLLQERYCVGQFSELEFTSESTINSEKGKFMLMFALDVSPARTEEVGADEVDVDDALNQLIRAGIVGARAARTMTDEQILAAYAEHFSNDLPEPKAKQKAKPVVEEFDDFDDENEEEEEHELEEQEEEEQEIAHISLPPSMFKGYVVPKAHEASKVMTALAESWEVQPGDIFPGVLLQYNKAGEEEPLEVAYIGLAIHKGATSLMVVDTSTLSDDPEVKARRIVLKLDAACERCLPLYEEEAEEEEESEIEIDELDVDDESFQLDVE